MAGPAQRSRKAAAAGEVSSHLPLKAGLAQGRTQPAETSSMADAIIAQR
jgi:hypothetical protein